MMRYTIIILLVSLAPLAAEAQDVKCEFTVVCKEQEPCTKGDTRQVEFNVSDPDKQRGILQIDGLKYSVAYAYRPGELLVVRYPLGGTMIQLGTPRNGMRRNLDGRMQYLNSETSQVWTFYGTCGGW